MAANRILLARVVDSKGAQIVRGNRQRVYEVIDSPATTRNPVPGWPKIATRLTLPELQQDYKYHYHDAIITTLVVDSSTGVITARDS